MIGIGKLICGIVMLWLLSTTVAADGTDGRAVNMDGILETPPALDDGNPDGNSPPSEDNASWWPLALLAVYCLLIVLASLGGGWLPMLMTLTHNRMQLMLSLVGGLMLGIGMFHMLPHAVHEMQSLDRAVRWMMAGMLTMFFLIRLFHTTSC